MSSTVTISVQRSYIKIETLRGKNPTEIRGALSEVDRSTGFRWTNHFHGGCVRIDNDPRPGSLRTSTDERSVKLVADTLEEDCRATCEELSRATGAKMSQENAQEPTSVARGLAAHSFSVTMLARTSRALQQKIFAIMGYSCALQSSHESTRLRLIPKVKF